MNSALELFKFPLLIRLHLQNQKVKKKPFRPFTADHHPSRPGSVLRNASNELGPLRQVLGRAAVVGAQALLPGVLRSNPARRSGACHR